MVSAFFMFPTGIEPAHIRSERNALSTELRTDDLMPGPPGGTSAGLQRRVSQKLPGEKPRRGDKGYLNLVPAGTESSRNTIFALPSGISEHMSIPWETSPASLAGFRLAAKTTVLPISSSGEYHFAIPESTCLVPLPSSRMNLRSFFEPLSFSHSTTFAALSSILISSSMSISGRLGSSGVWASSGLLASGLLEGFFSSSSFLSFSISALSSSKSFLESILANKGSDCLTLSPAV